MVEGARLESVYTVTPYRGFESLSLRQSIKSPMIGAFFMNATNLVAEQYEFTRIGVLTHY